MAKTDYQSVDGYLEAQAEVARAVLARVRAVVRKALPKAEEGISYQMPAYRLPEGWVIYIGAWKQHYSLYPVSAGVVAALGSALAPFDVEKGTIRFPWVDPVPVRLIAQIVKARAREVVEDAAAKAATKAATKAGAAKPTATRSSTAKVAKAKPAKAATKPAPAKPRSRAR